MPSESSNLYRATIEPSQDDVQTLGSVMVGVKFYLLLPILYFTTLTFPTILINYLSLPTFKQKNKQKHKNKQNALIYTHLINFENDEFHTAVANNVEKACKLVEAGFEYVTGEYGDGGKIFRKRK
jgi:hypothetical protein